MLKKILIGTILIATSALPNASAESKIVFDVGYEKVSMISAGTTAEDYFELGSTAYKAKKYADAINYFSKAIELDPQDIDAYYNRGLSYTKAGNLTQAITDFNVVIRFNPRDSVAYHNRGYAYYELGNLVQAINDYNSALSFNPYLSEAYYNRGSNLRL